MPVLLGGLLFFVVALVYLATPFFAIVAWRRTRRIADLERRLKDAERRLVMTRGMDWAGLKGDGEPIAIGAASVASRDGPRFDAAAVAAPKPALAAPPTEILAGTVLPADPAAHWPLVDEVSGRPEHSEPPSLLPEPEQARQPETEPEPGPEHALRSLLEPLRETVTESWRRGWRSVGDAWEEGIGGGVLARIGAVLVVIGVALFVGWSMLHLGPVGRVAIALALSGSLLAAGLTFQRWPDYRAVAIGLGAAGWGGLYVTAYSMHGLEAARVIHDPLTAFGLLLAVAAGMIVHALWLGVPTFVAAAYAAAFAAVALGPASTSAIVACLVLATTLLAVAARYDWMNFAVAGVVCTYGILAFRSPPADPVPGIAGLTIPYVLIWACWLLFEAFDVLMAARRRGRTDAGQVVMPLNLCGLLGVTLLLWPVDTEGYDLFLGAAAAAYGTSTLCRVAANRMSPARAGTRLAAAAAPVAYEASITIAAVLWAAALGVRFAGGWRLHVGLLLEAEFLFLAGVLFAQRHLRVLAASLFAVALVRFVGLDVPSGGDIAVRGLTLTSWTPSALLAAAVLVIDCVILHALGRQPLLAAERGFTYAATALVTLVIGGEVWRGHNGLDPAMLGVGWLVQAWILLQIAARRRFADGYRQACLVAFAAIVPLVGINAFSLFPVPAAGRHLEVWMWLLPAVVILHALVWQVTRAEWLAAVEPPAADVTALGLIAASGLTLVLLWHALPAPLVALGWAAFALLALHAGLRMPHAGLRWHAFIAVALTVGRLFLANFTNTGMTGFVSHRLLTVVPVVILLYHVAARLTDHRLRTLVGPAERTFGGVCCWAGTAVLVVLLRFELGRVLAVVGWAILGLVLLARGRRVNAHLRWQSHAIALLTFARSWGTNLSMPEAPGGLFQPWTLGGLVVTGLFASELLCPPDGHVKRPLTGVARLLAWLDAHRRSYYAILGTAVLAVLLVNEAPASLLTATLGIEGAGLLVLGFVRPDRSLRMCGLAVLGICVPKLFFWDLRHLETPYRILSFLLLGLLLIAMSWCYARFKQQLRSIV